MDILRKYIEVNDDQNVLFLSDFHFWHKNIIKFDKRPFDDVIQMNEALIHNWNEVVRPDDIVFFLGDFAFSSKNKARELAHRLMGKIYFILGNHDTPKDINYCDRFEGIFDRGEIKVKHQDWSNKEWIRISLNHFPELVWNKHHKGDSWMLHGHCHQSLKKNMPNLYKRKIEDVGLMGWDYKPVDFMRLNEIMSKREVIPLDHHE